jgi:O-antigen ligase
LTIYLLLYILFFYIIVWQGFAIDNLKFATQFIENTLQKDTSFTERIYLWEEASYLIQNSMWFGYGVQSPEWMMEKIGGSGPHNFWILNLLQGGLLLCGIFVMIVLESIINTFRNSTAKSRWALACLCIMMLMSLFETYNIICIFMVIIMLHFTLKIPDEK